jgi:hypothetical protein
MCERLACRENGGCATEKDIGGKHNATTLWIKQISYVYNLLHLPALLHAAVLVGCLLMAVDMMGEMSKTCCQLAIK